MKYIVLDKKIGETPLEAIHSWRKSNPVYANMKASYAGRLDPMASGKLLILLGDECKKQKRYTNLDKEYEIEVLLDVESDTGDVLGIPTYAHKDTQINEDLLTVSLSSELGAHAREYPAFSSKTVSGKPLFLHSLSGDLLNIEMPKHIEHIYKIKKLDTYALKNNELRDKISGLLDLSPRTTEPSKRLGENFRIDTIRPSWESVFENLEDRKFSVVRIRVTCASGTYMRSLARRIGESLGTSGITLSIKRTKIGRYIHLYKEYGIWNTY